MKKDDTLIPVKKRTRKRIRTFGIKGETYDKILNRFMNLLEEKKDRNG